MEAPAQRGPSDPNGGGQAQEEAPLPREKAMDAEQKAPGQSDERDVSAAKDIQVDYSTSKPDADEEVAQPSDSAKACMPRHTPKMGRWPLNAAIISISRPLST